MALFRVFKLCPNICYDMSYYHYLSIVYLQRVQALNDAAKAASLAAAQHQQISSYEPNTKHNNFYGNTTSEIS